MIKYQTANFSSPKEMRQAITDFKAGACEVLETGYLAAGGKILLPVVTIDTTGRPDLLDLARVHRSDGQFDTQTNWDFVVKPRWTGLARFTVKITRPISTQFSILFHLNRHTEFLESLVTASEFPFLSVKMNKAPLQDALSFAFEPISLVEGLDTDDMARSHFKPGRGGRM